MKLKMLKRALACFLATAVVLPIVPIAAGCEKGGEEGDSSTYTVWATSSDTEQGKVKGDGEVYNDGTLATVIAEAEPHHKFVGWYDAATNEEVSKEDIYTFVSEENVSLIAKFVPVEYMITTAKNPVDGGSTLGDGMYYYNASAILSAETSKGYEFVGWYKDGEDNKSCSTEYYPIVVKGDQKYVARWNAVDYVVEVSSEDGPKENLISGAGKYSMGQVATLKVDTAAAVGYQFDGWYEGTTKLSVNTSYSFTVISDRQIVAKWVPKTYEVSVGKNVDDLGTIYVNNQPETNDVFNGTFTHGEVINLKVETTSEDFLGWYVGNVALSTQKECTYTVESAVSITARWKTELQEYQITVKSDNTSAGNVFGSATKLEGSKATVTAMPKAGYTFLGWYEGNTLVSSDASYTFTVTRNRTLTAKWQFNTYDIAIETDAVTGNVQDAGSVSGAKVYNHGANVTLRATTNVGYEFLGWYENGSATPVSEAAEYTFVATADRTLTARWKLKEYSINVTKSNDAAGSITGGGKVYHGESITLTATANSPYQFKGWKEAGASGYLSTDTTYTFTANRSMNIIADFSKELPVPSGSHHLEIRVYSGGYGMGWIEEAAEVFTQKYPNYTVNILGDTGMYDTLKLQLDNDNCAADIALISDVHYNELALKGKLACLDDVLESTVPGGDETIKSVIPQAHYDYRDMTNMTDWTGGSQYGIPWQDNTATGIIYNKTFFKENNLTIPKTMNEYYALCNQIIRLDKGIAPLTYCGGVSYGYTQNILNQWFVEDVGYEYMSETFFNYDHVDNFIGTESTREKVYSAIAKMLKTSGYATTNSKSLAADQSITEFLTEKAAMMICGSWFPTEAAIKLALKENFDYGFFGIPHINDGEVDRNGNDSSDVRYSLQANSLVVPAMSDEQAVAKLFLAELYSEQCLQIFVAENNGVSRPMTTTHDTSSIDTTTKRGAFAQQVYTYFKGTVDKPTKMYYEISLARPAQNGTLCPTKTVNNLATDGDTLGSIIKAGTLDEALRIAVTDAKSETEWVIDKWDYSTNNWKADYLK